MWEKQNIPGGGTRICRGSGWNEAGILWDRRTAGRREQREGGVATEEGRSQARDVGA